MARKRIFVSCGQHTDEEKSFGRKILKLIDSHGMTGFFAEEAHQPADLNIALFNELQRCDGFLAVMQKRGEVRYEKFPVKHRASVWIQQEVGILFYRSFLLGRALPMRIYTEEGILHEGLTRYSIINPIPFEKNETVLEDLSQWLEGPMFEEQPALARRESIFNRRIQELKEEDWLLLELVAAHSYGPGDTEVETEVWQDFVAILSEQGKDKLQAGDVYSASKSRLTAAGLIVPTSPKQTGVVRLGIPKQWWDLVLEKLRGEGRM